MKGISIFTAYQLKHWNSQTEALRGGWTPARPMGMTGIWWRLRMAWKVFTGKGDVVIWKNQ